VPVCNQIEASVFFRLGCASSFVTRQIVAWHRDQSIKIIPTTVFLHGDVWQNLAASVSSFGATLQCNTGLLHCYH
jgi:hypothetical protein